MKVHEFSPLVVYETEIPGFKDSLLELHSHHSFNHENGMITGELNGKVLVHQDPNFKSFFHQVKLKVQEYMDFLSFDHTLYELNFVKSWYTVCTSKYNVPPHHHSCSHISYVYYLKTPPNDPLCFRIDNPNEWFGDAFYFAFKRDNYNGWIHTVQPSDESLLIFPGKIQHFTRGPRTSERICIAGDVLLTLKENMLDYESGLLPSKYWSQF